MWRLVTQMSDADNEGVGDLFSTPNETPTDEKPKTEGKPRSIVWQHFTKLEKQPGIRDECQCNYCSRVYTCRTNVGTSHLRRHIFEGGCPNFKQNPKSPPHITSKTEWSDHEPLRKSSQWPANGADSFDDQTTSLPEDIQPLDIPPISLIKPTSKKKSESNSVHLNVRDEAARAMKKFLVVNLTENNLDLNATVTMVNQVFTTLELLKDDDANFNETVQDLISSYKRLPMEIDEQEMKEKLERRKKLLTEKNEMVKEVTTLKSTLSNAIQYQTSLQNRIGVLMNKVQELEKELYEQESKVSSLQTKLDERNEHLTKIGDELIDTDVKVEQVQSDLKRRSEAMPALERAKSRLRYLVRL